MSLVIIGGDPPQFPMLLLSDIPEFQPGPDALTRGYVRGRTSVGADYKGAEGMRILDSEGRLFEVRSAVIREIKRGPVISSTIGRIMYYLGLGLSAVGLEMKIQQVAILSPSEARDMLAQINLQSKVFSQSVARRPLLESSVAQVIESFRDQG